MAAHLGYQHVMILAIPYVNVALTTDPLSFGTI